jgi:hypothetical protein
MRRCVLQVNTLKEKAAKLSGFFMASFAVQQGYSCIDTCLANWYANKDAHVATTAQSQ